LSIDFSGLASGGITPGVSFDFSADTDSLSIGDIRPVPLPPALWLFGSGLLGLIGIAKKKST
jgi:hypothetical protein